MLYVCQRLLMAQVGTTYTTSARQGQNLYSSKCYCNYKASLACQCEISQEIKCHSVQLSFCQLATLNHFSHQAKAFPSPLWQLKQKYKIASESWQLRVLQSLQSWCGGGGSSSVSWNFSVRNRRCLYLDFVLLILKESQGLPHRLLPRGGKARLVLTTFSAEKQEMDLLNRQDSLHPRGSCLLPRYRGALGPQLFLGLLHRKDPHHSTLKKTREQAGCGAAIIVMMPFLLVLTWSLRNKDNQRKRQILRTWSNASTA